MIYAFERRPLTNNRWLTAGLYGMLGALINNTVNHFWVTPQNPEGLTGFAGYVLLFTSVGFCCWLSYKENRWLDERLRITP